MSSTDEGKQPTLDFRAPVFDSSKDRSPFVINLDARYNGLGDIGNSKHFLSIGGVFGAHFIFRSRHRSSCFSLPVLDKAQRIRCSCFGTHLGKSVATYRLHESVCVRAYVIAHPIRPFFQPLPRVSRCVKSFSYSPMLIVKVRVAAFVLQRSVDSSFYRHHLDSPK